MCNDMYVLSLGQQHCIGLWNDGCRDVTGPCQCCHVVLKGICPCLQDHVSYFVSAKEHHLSHESHLTFMRFAFYF